MISENEKFSLKFEGSELSNCEIQPKTCRIFRKVEIFGSMNGLCYQKIKLKNVRGVKCFMILQFEGFELSN